MHPLSCWLSGLFSKKSAYVSLSSSSFIILLLVLLLLLLLYYYCCCCCCRYYFLFSVGDTVVKTLHTHFTQSERKHVTDVDVLIWQRAKLTQQSPKLDLYWRQVLTTSKCAKLRVDWFTMLRNSSISSYKYSALLYVFATTLNGNNTSDVLQCITVIVVCDRWSKV